MNPSARRVVAKFLLTGLENPRLEVKSPALPAEIAKWIEDEEGNPILPKKRWAEGVRWTQKGLGKKAQFPMAVIDDIEEALKNPRAADRDEFIRKVLPKALKRAGPLQYKRALELLQSARNKIEGGYIKPTIQSWMPKGKRYVSERENMIFWLAVKETAAELVEDWQYSSWIDQYKEDATKWALERWQELWG